MLNRTMGIGVASSMTPAFEDKTYADFNIQFVDRQYAAIGKIFDDGMSDYFKAGWMPDRPM